MTVYIPQSYDEEGSRIMSRSSQHFISRIVFYFSLCIDMGFSVQKPRHYNYFISYIDTVKVYLPFH